MPTARPAMFVLMLSLLACSCNRQGGPETFPVSGVVTMQGQPVEGASVSFESVGGGAGSLVAITDAQGKFMLQTYIGNDQPKDGLAPGEYRVAITKLEVVSDMRRRPKDLLPKKFRDAKTSGLSATVAAGSNEFNFSLD